MVEDSKSTGRRSRASTVSKVKTPTKPRSIKQTRTTITTTKRKPRTVSVSRVKTPIVPVTPPRDLSIYRKIFKPVDMDRLMSQTARYAGTAFVVLGAVFTLLLTPELWKVKDALNEIGQVAATSYSSQSSSAQGTVVSTPTTTTATVTTAGSGYANAGATMGNTTISTSTGNSSSLSSYMMVDKQPPLSGAVKVKAVTPNARKVEFYVFTESWQNKTFLGLGTQTSADVWIYNWDTTTVPNGLNYRLSAVVWEISDTSDNPDYTLQLDYMMVDNTVNSEGKEVLEETVLDVDQTPVATISVLPVLTGTSYVNVTVLEASAVQLVVEHKSSGSRNVLYDSSKNSTNSWRIKWPTAQYQDGDYVLTARIKNQYGTYNSGSALTTIINGTDETLVPAEEEKILGTGLVEEVVTPLEVSKPELPTVSIKINSNTELMGTVPILSEVSGGNANSVYFFVRDTLSVTPRFIGSGVRRTVNTWSYNWYTNNTPNGTYWLSAMANTGAGQMTSKETKVTVSNNIAAVEPTQIERKVEIVNAVEEVATEVPEIIKPPSDLLIVESSPQGGDDSRQSNSLQTQTGETKTAQDIIEEYQERFDAELIRLGTAYRNGNTAAVERIKARLYTLAEEIAQKSNNSKEVEKSLLSEIESLTAKYLVELERTESILKERQRIDVLRDTDGDGISDFDEVAMYNTDPMVADTDGDGFTDGAEILAGYDPLSDVRESVIVYESPKEAGVFREDILKVESLEMVQIETPTAASSSGVVGVEKKPAILIAGKALPNSFVTLYIYSTPVIVTVKTDDEGSWEYRFEKELEDGTHNVYVGLTDNAGKVVAKSQPFGFIKEAAAVTPVEAASLENVMTDAEDKSLLSNYVFLAIVSISVVAIGLVLILLGLHLDGRRKGGVVV